MIYAAAALAVFAAIALGMLYDIDRVIERELAAEQGEGGIATAACGADGPHPSSAAHDTYPSRRAPRPRRDLPARRPVRTRRD